MIIKNILTFRLEFLDFGLFFFFYLSIWEYNYFLICLLLIIFYSLSFNLRIVIKHLIECYWKFINKCTKYRWIKLCNCFAVLGSNFYIVFTVALFHRHLQIVKGIISLSAKFLKLMQKFDIRTFFYIVTKYTVKIRMFSVLSSINLKSCQNRTHCARWFTIFFFFAFVLNTLFPSFSLTL